MQFNVNEQIIDLDRHFDLLLKIINERTANASLEGYYSTIKFDQNKIE